MKKLIKKPYTNCFMTSEAVGPGHPDKICDQIADAILYECIKQDSKSRVACEVFASNRLILIGGEINTKGYVDVVCKAWEIVKKLGYTEQNFLIFSTIHSQSVEISKSVDNKKTIGAGDQGITVGYAIAETRQLMPVGTIIAQELIRRTCELNDSSSKKYISANKDMKSQVTIFYDEKGNFNVHSIVMSIQHLPKINLNNFRNYIQINVVEYVLKKLRIKTSVDKINLILNPTDSFSLGGLISDTGLTGRKLLVDSYGCYAKHGGGSLSGKDGTKVDRTGAYYARMIAKHVVAANLAYCCEVQISWVIGKPKPIKISVECFDTNVISMQNIYKIVNGIFNHDLKEIIEMFELNAFDFCKVSMYGHFGREELDLPWERLAFIKKISDLIPANNKKYSKI